ncbi:MAG: BPSS1780 family membrane protein [Xanthomonadales bacterium]|nr:BPSS1780 family membrane protein [Xanthomonadales bacterium]
MDMPPKSPNEIKRVPAGHGIGWLLQSLQLMRLQVSRLLFIAVLMQVILGLTQIPLLGLLVILAVPALSAGILEAFHVIAQGGRPAVALLFRPLLSGAHSSRLFAMGALMFLIGVLVMSLLLSGSERLFDPELMARIEQGDMDALAELDQESVGRMAIAFLAGIAISGTLSYFTVPLIWFQNRKLVPALVDGLKALLLNWKPFLTLAAVLAGVLMLVGVLAGSLFTASASAGGMSVLVMALVMLLLLAFQLLLFGTQYCSFRDIFELTPPGAPPTEPDEGQLVA